MGRQGRELLKKERKRRSEEMGASDWTKIGLAELQVDRQ